MLFKNTLDLKSQQISKFLSFEYTEVLLKAKRRCIRIVLIYRPPPSAENKLTFSMFVREFTCLLEELSITSGELLIFGDFNLHVENSSDSHACQFLDLLTSFGLQNHVTNPTHVHGHVLDLVITRVTENIISNVSVHGQVVSDHNSVIFNLAADKPSFLSKNISYRKWKNVDIKDFTFDVAQSALVTTPADNVSALVTQYNSTLTELADKHAPLCQRRVTVRPRAPWYNDEIAAAKRLRRKLEHKWLKSGLVSDNINYKNQCKIVANMIHDSKSFYYNNKIKETDGDQKKMFQVIDKVLRTNEEPPLPSCSSNIELADKFADFFITKISDIRKNLTNNAASCYASPDCDLSVYCDICSPLMDLTPASCEEIAGLIKGSPGKSCLLDPIPTWLTKKCIEVLTPVITSIVNMSLSSAVMPADFKEAILLPLLKKICLDPEIFNNFRPISNLMYISKLIERVVASRLHSHLITNDLYEEYQSSYRKLHSTETALVSVHDDILRAIDDNKCILLIMLDLSAAFDTVDHEILLRRLSCMLGISGSALQWFRSYLTDRKQKVVVNDVFSKSTSLTCGVPQGSVLGPILFTIYMLPLGEIIRSHGVQFHMYADDCQLYITCDSPDLNYSISKMESLISDIRVWYSRNMLKLNDSKTEMLVIRSKFRQNFHFRDISIGESIVSPSPTIRNLGVIMDPTYTMSSHVSHLVQVAFLKLRELS